MEQRPRRHYISIHALREEGDRADRPYCCCSPDISIHALREEGDLLEARQPVSPVAISIHALREEGDRATAQTAMEVTEFLSTPSARRATPARPPERRASRISIHALREEGDWTYRHP